MNNKYIFITPEQLGKAINNAPFNTRFDFTFEQSTADFHYGTEPTGWYGATITTIFNEFQGIFTIGYYGGGCTRTIDIEFEWYNKNIETCIIEALKDYINNQANHIEKICVEVTDENRLFLEKVI